MTMIVPSVSCAPLPYLPLYIIRCSIVTCYLDQSRQHMNKLVIYVCYYFSSWVGIINSLMLHTFLMMIIEMNFWCDEKKLFVAKPPKTTQSNLQNCERIESFLVHYVCKLVFELKVTENIWSKRLVLSIKQKIMMF